MWRDDGNWDDTSTWHDTDVLTLAATSVEEIDGYQKPTVIGGATNNDLTSSLTIPPITTNTDLSVTGIRVIILCNNVTPTTITITIEPEAEVNGNIINVIRTGSDTVTITCTSGHTFNGNATYDLTTQWESVAMVYDAENTQWIICY